MKERAGTWAGAVFAFAILSAQPVRAQFWQWKTWTSSKEVQDIALDSANVWIATSGGLVRIATANLETQKYTNTEGLTGNDVRAVAIDRYGNVWLGLGNGYLNRLDPRTNEVRVITDYVGREIYDLVVKGDSLYVGLSLGVSLYLIDRAEVKETYKNLGDAFPVEVAAKAIVIRSDTIWVATDYGIAYADLTLPNLQAPDFWRNVTSADGLPSDAVRDVTWYEGRLFAATANGLAAKEGDTWVLVAFNEDDVRDLEVWQDSLVAALSWGVMMRSSGGRWVHVGESPKGCRKLAVDPLGRLWVGTEEYGVWVFDQGVREWSPVTPNEPGGNNITDMAFDQNGVLWCTSLNSGVFSYDGTTWRTFKKETGHLPTNAVLAVAVDAQNRKWFGTRGRGAVVFTETDTGIVVTRYSSEDGKLAGSDTPEYVIVSGVETDALGNVWLLNKFANNGRAVAVVTPVGEWVYFSTYEGLKSNLVISLAFDHLGRAWVGTEQDGVQVIDYGEDLVSHADDDLSQGLTSTEDGLESNLVRSIAVDQSGVVWIGTDEGLNFWFEGQVGVRYGLISEDIYRVAVDPQDNKWIGTVGGITILDPDGYPQRHFTTENSPLVWPHVQAFAFEAETGLAFVGTTNGISQVTTPYTAPKPDLSEVSVYPNPLRLQEGGPKLTITNLARESRIRIFTADGQLVRNFLPNEVPGGRVLWDGRNDRGELVASGVYLVLVTTRTGLSAVRKVAVVR